MYTFTRFLIITAMSIYKLPLYIINTKIINKIDRCENVSISVYIYKENSAILVLIEANEN